MFYSHAQARDKLPKKRRRVLPVEHLPRALALRSNPCPNVLHPRPPVTLMASNLTSNPISQSGGPAGSSGGGYTPRGSAGFSGAGGGLPINYYKLNSMVNTSSAAAAPMHQHATNISAVDSHILNSTINNNNQQQQQQQILALSAHQNMALVPRAATSDHYWRSRINLSNKDLLPDSTPTIHSDTSPHKSSSIKKQQISDNDLTSSGKQTEDASSKQEKPTDDTNHDQQEDSISDDNNSCSSSPFSNRQCSCCNDRKESSDRSTVL